MDKKKSYLNLLSKSYDEAVKILLEKYGPAKDDYYREKSYERFLNGEIKNITRGKYSRSFEGLECHHIDENKCLNISNQDFIKIQNIPFEYHKKDRLVFCDIIEHAILHVLIAKETKLEFGYPGYTVFLRKKIEDWYIKKDIPKKSKWHIACYDKAFVSTEVASELLRVMDNIISEESDRIKQEKLRTKKAVIQKGDFKSLSNQSSSKEIVRAMYELNKVGAQGYSREFITNFYLNEGKERKRQIVSFKDFEKNMQKYDLSGLLKTVQLYIDYVEGNISRQDYDSQKWSFDKTKKEIEEERRIKREEFRIKQEEEAEEKRRKKAFYTRYPNLKKTGLDHYANRQDVNALLFKYNEEYPTFIKFQAAMKQYDLNDLLEKLNDILEE